METKPKYNKSTRVVSSSGKVVHINSYGESLFGIKNITVGCMKPHMV